MRGMQRHSSGMHARTERPSSPPAAKASLFPSARLSPHTLNLFLPSDAASLFPPCLSPSSPPPLPPSLPLSFSRTLVLFLALSRVGGVALCRRPATRDPRPRPKSATRDPRPRATRALSGSQPPAVTLHFLTALSLETSIKLVIGRLRTSLHPSEANVPPYFFALSYCSAKA